MVNAVIYIFEPENFQRNISETTGKAKKAEAHLKINFNQIYFSDYQIKSLNVQSPSEVLF